VLTGIGGAVAVARSQPARSGPAEREEDVVRRKVNDVMTVDVATARAHMPYRELVRLLGQRRVSALPVVDSDQHVLGVVVAADLAGKPGASTAGELMRRPAITVGAEATVAEAVRLLREHGVKRLPVTDQHGRLVGIVNRSDLLSVFLRHDEEIRQEILEVVIFSQFGLGLDRFQVTVADGVVRLEGCCPRRGLIPAVVKAVTAVEGVVRVDNELGYDLDDTAPRTSCPCRRRV
jgi:CBS-domain-containing membrane protein